MRKSKTNSLNRNKTKEAKAKLIHDYFDVYCEHVHQGKWIPSAHHKLICDKMQDVMAGKIKRLMIFMPPQNGKSVTVSETFPSFFLGHNPDKSAIISSYSGTLAERFGRLNRQKLENYGKEIFGIELSKEKGSQKEWEIAEHAGGLISAGIGGSITGHGANLLILDDPIKNRMEANSITYRNRIWEEWQSTLRTRVRPDGIVIIILTRWHEDDLAGRLITNSLDTNDLTWKILSLPAICESPDDPLGRKIGDPLWVEGGYDLPELNRIKKTIGSMAWNALYQQRPHIEEGGIIQRQWWQFYDMALDSYDMQIQSWDCAFKNADDSDYVVGQVWGRKGADYYLIDQIRSKLSFTGTLNAIRHMSQKHPFASAILIEDKANGTAVIDTLQREISGLIPIEPKGGKVVRAQAVSPIIEAGNVYLPNTSIAPWIHDFVEEFTSFPQSMNDDQVDATTQALTWIRYRGGVSEASIDKLNNSDLFATGHTRQGGWGY